MFDSTDFIGSGGSEPPTPDEPPTYDLGIRDPVFHYAPEGPIGWYVARVEKEPFPNAYVLTIWKAGDCFAVIYRDTFCTWRGQLRTDGALHLGFAAARRRHQGSNRQHRRLVLDLAAARYRRDR